MRKRLFSLIVYSDDHNLGVTNVSVQKKIHIIGVGDDGADGLSARAVSLIADASLLIGPNHLTSGYDKPGQQIIEAGNSLDALAERLTSHSEERIVILTPGDPLFYGTARFLCERLGKDRFEVIPHVSSMQLAFARVKESWEEAYLTNLANQSIDHVINKIRSAERVGVFTTPEFPPNHLAQSLIQAGIDYFTGYVCENLGAPDERVTAGDLSDIAKASFGELNVFVLVRKPDVPDRPTTLEGRRLFGNPDELFLQSKPKRGLLTNSEIRVIALAELDIGPNSIVWDIGAGSGSVSLEAAQLCPAGHVYAVEMDTDDYELIIENAARFGLSNITPVLGQAPEAWSDLPAPDAIFIGGTGRQLTTIVRDALAQLKPGGRLVADMASIDNLNTVQEVLRQETGDVNILMVNIARGNYQLDRLLFDAMTPKFVLSAIKKQS